MKFDQDFEEDILATAMLDIAYLRKASRILDSHHFNSPQHGWVWDCIKDTWNNYRELTNTKIILSRVKADFPKEEDRIPYVSLVSKLYKRKPVSSKAALEELAIFVKTVNAQLAMEKAALSLEKGKVEETYNALRKLIHSDSNKREYVIVNWIEDFESRQRERRLRREHPELYTSIPTGWKRIDSVIDGIELGELGLIMATTGKGKSIGLTNIAHYAVTHGFPTVYFPLEMPARQVAMRQDARWLGYQYKKFKQHDWSPNELAAIEKRLKKIEGKWKGLFKIVSMPLRKCTIDVIGAALEELEQEHSFKPKLILIDSGDHMKSTSRSENYRLDQADVYWSLKSLAEEGGYAIWSSTQAGREWATRVATAEATSESYDKARIADIVISINTPEKNSRSTKIAINEDGEDISKVGNDTPITSDINAELFLAKYRDGQSKITVPIRCDFSKMLIEELRS